MDDFDEDEFEDEDDEDDDEERDDDEDEEEDDDEVCIPILRSLESSMLIKSQEDGSRPKQEAAECKQS